MTNDVDKKDVTQEVKKPSKSIKVLLLEYINSCETYNILSVVIVIIASLTILFISFNECKSCFEKLSKSDAIEDTSQKNHFKNYWVYGKNVDSGYLSNVFLILERLGYQNNPNTSDWDILWAHDYPFRKLYSKLNNLKFHQKVNHFPGCGYITNKVDLATSRLKFIPPAFKLPDHKKELLAFMLTHTTAQFVQKNNDHRHIKLKNVSEINFDDAKGTFVQEYVDSPLLVSGYKFDIGIYTIITSIDPLRVYIYNGDALLRFCPVKYEPFDSENIDKYVVGDDYLPTWEVPGLKYYYNTLGFGMKESLNAYLRAKGKTPELIWEQIEESLRIVILNKEPKILDVVKRFKSKHNFFEMMRFDFVVDENLRVYLMEANMSPNLSSAHFPRNKLLFEQVIYNVFSLVGIGVRLNKNTLARSVTEKNMESADKNIAVYPEECHSALCRSSCLPTNCQLCKNCLTEENRINFLRAHNEHLNRADCKRIFPPAMTSTFYSLADLEKYSENNRMMYKWFLGKCLMDETWCK